MLPQLVRRTALVVAIAAIAAACSTTPDTLVGSESLPAGATSSATDQPVADVGTTASDDQAAVATGGAAASLEEANEAVIQIFVVGSFVEPDTGPIEGVGYGTGFFISPDGLAVTNNHVVTGAGFLEIRVPGEDEPRRASVLGVSECADLAVIEVEGEDFPYVDFYNEPLAVGLPVYAAGYPLGDPEFTLTQGILAKKTADGQSSWASVDSVIEHDARIRPGNSGGPLFTQDGQVVAVNYAGNDLYDQNFAIAATDALPVIESLKNGDVDSIGVNATALSIGDVPGIWVSSVETGSPADEAGILPGDFIVKLENLTVGARGTMETYCEVLKGRAANAQIRVELIRPSTGEILAGNVNGTNKLEVIFAPDAAGSVTVSEGAQPYTEFTTVTDDAGIISVQVPAAWNQTFTGALESPFNNGDAPIVIASNNIDSIIRDGEFVSDFTNPAVAMVGFYAPTISMDAILQEQVDYNVQINDCLDTSEPSEYSGGDFAGTIILQSSCGPNRNASILYVSATEINGTRGLFLAIQILSDADADTVATILQSMRYLN